MVASALGMFFMFGLMQMNQNSFENHQALKASLDFEDQNRHIAHILSKDDYCSQSLQGQNFDPNSNTEQEVIIRHPTQTGVNLLAAGEELAGSAFSVKSVTLRKSLDSSGNPIDWSGDEGEAVLRIYAERKKQHSSQRIKGAKDLFREIHLYLKTNPTGQIQGCSVLSAGGSGPINPKEVCEELGGQYFPDEPIPQKRCKLPGPDCDWYGWYPRPPVIMPGQVSEYCRNGKLIDKSSRHYLADSCETRHAKGYHCKLNVYNNGLARVECDSGENHGEWRGSQVAYDSIRNILHSEESRIHIDGKRSKGMLLDYDRNTGKWRLQSIGKENNHRDPRYSLKTCSASVLRFPAMGRTDDGDDVDDPPRGGGPRDDI